MGQADEKGKINVAEECCLAKLKPNEPFFVLKASDIWAIPLVSMWIQFVETQGVPNEMDKRKITEARNWMEKARNWQQENEGRPKFPD